MTFVSQICTAPTSNSVGTKERFDANIADTNCTSVATLKTFSVAISAMDRYRCVRVSSRRVGEIINNGNSISELSNGMSQRGPKVSRFGSVTYSTIAAIANNAACQRGSCQCAGASIPAQMRSGMHRILRRSGAVLASMATDFTDGKTFPRPGRLPYEDTLWLLRVFDKARAAAAVTIHDYIYPCPMDQGVFSRWGITSSDFDQAIREHTTDEAIFAWLKTRATPEGILKANEWLIREKIENLDRQDAEEGVAV